MVTFNIGVHIGGYSSYRYDEDGRHECWIDTFSVQAVTPRGDVFILIGSDTRDEAFAQDCLAFLVGTPDTHPDLWDVGDPVYGSNAWDGEAEYNLACFEADCYGEPRPRWA